MSKNPYPTQQGTSPSAPYGGGYPQQQQPPQPGLYPSVNQGFPSAPPSYDQSQQQAASGWQAPQQQTSSYPTAGPPYSGGAGATSPYPQSQEKPQQQPGYAPMNYGGPADQPSQKGQTPYPTQGGGVTYVQVPMPVRLQRIFFTTSVDITYCCFYSTGRYLRRRRQIRRLKRAHVNPTTTAGCSAKRRPGCANGRG